MTTYCQIARYIPLADLCLLVTITLTHIWQILIACSQRKWALSFSLSCKHYKPRCSQQGDVINITEAVQNFLNFGLNFKE